MNRFFLWILQFEPTQINSSKATQGFCTADYWKKTNINNWFLPLAKKMSVTLEGIFWRREYVTYQLAGTIYFRRDPGNLIIGAPGLSPSLSYINKSKTKR